MRRITPRQEALLAAVSSAFAGVNVHWDEERGVASSLRGPLVGGDIKDADAVFRKFLDVYGELFGPPGLTSRLHLLRDRTDDIGWRHLEYQMTHPAPTGSADPGKELEVWGARIAGHFNASGELVEVQSSCRHEVQETAGPTLDVKALRESLFRAAETAPGFASLAARVRERGEESFPVMQQPRMALHPWKGGFRWCWITYAYVPMDVDQPGGQPTGRTTLDLAQVFVDARTGERFVAAPMRMSAEAADSGSGLASTPLGGPFTTRSLKIVREAATTTYRLRDTSHARDIVTYDVAASANFSDGYEVADGIRNGTLPKSEDTDGNKTWSTTAATTQNADRTASQQPEVDAHYYVGEIYEWYHALAGSRAGWDDGEYSDPPVPAGQAVSVLTHAYDDSAATSRSVGAYFNNALRQGKWYPFLAFFDGNPTQTSGTNARGFDYLSGSKFVVAHEYQHAITNFSFKDYMGNPGLSKWDWLGAVHEGLSDVFGCLCSGNWVPGPEFSNAGLVLRNLAYPRDANAWSNMPGPLPNGLNNHNRDHFADRNLGSGFFEEYDRGTILAHAAYLMAAGGVHQRASRSPVLIPVYGTGRELRGGLDVYKAARIWYRALTWYFSTHGASTGMPSDSESAFRTLRNGCVSAAIDLYGANSIEHLTTVLAFYAVGLHPAGTSYGADPTFLRWGNDWRTSRPYIGLNGPDWASLDLFVNNGGPSEWNALVNVDDGGMPTQFENTVYCRVRNVGDQAATNVQVTFEYAKISSAGVTWLTVADANGDAQTLNVGTLAAGASNFPDSDQNSPPASASVPWYLPPIPLGETVDHYCLKATVTSGNDVNPHNNWVQSNIAFAEYAPPAPFRMAFLAGNPAEREIEVLLQHTHTLPDGWSVKIEGLKKGMRLKPGATHPLAVVIAARGGADTALEPPYDGQVVGEITGSLTGMFDGTLTNVSVREDGVEGRLAGTLRDVGSLNGSFRGRLDRSTGQLSGAVTAVFQCVATATSHPACLRLDGCLRPNRRVEIAQLVDGVPIGGVTVQVQVPMPKGACAKDLPPTATTVSRERPR
jgi:Zn-dependent metalloprotease